MRFWRLSTKAYATRFDGGYGLLNDGRWNSAGRPITYAATVPSLCVLEKRVHVQSGALLRDLVFVEYEAPDTLPMTVVDLGDLPEGWQKDEALTRGLGDSLLRDDTTPLIRVPSAIVALPDSPDRNILINHAHPAHREIAVGRTSSFSLDLRLL